MPHIVILGTLDTKLDEILYLRSQIEAAFGRITSASNKITLIDCGRGTSPKNDLIDIKHEDLISASWAPQDDRKAKLDSMPRGEVVQFMAECARRCVDNLWSTDNSSAPHGIISAGGSGGTTLAAITMRSLPIGVPKLIVSTIASGDTGPIIGETDISMMYSVVDIAGTNELLRSILGNAAGAIVGMASAYEDSHGRHRKKAEGKMKTRVGITMFGVTTPCVDMARQHLENNYDVKVFVFHATGHGGKAMERLIEEGRLDAVLDITTTEIADLLMGGNMSAGPDRMNAALRAGIPNIISLGATDMVNFGPKETIPEVYKERQLFEHNANVTLMRTTQEECKKMGELMVEKIHRHAKRPDMLEVRIPKGGVSMIATGGAPFENELADKELRETIKRGLEGSRIRVVEDDREINDCGFAIDAAESLMRMIESQS